MDYKIGDKVVYPNHGVGMIEQINFGVMNGRTEKYFMVEDFFERPESHGSCNQRESVGLRHVIRNGETLKVLTFLEKGKPNSHHDWKHRFKENSERMRTGELIEVAAVLKSLVSLSRTKPLSFREKKMLERAKFLLVSELATAQKYLSRNHGRRTGQVPGESSLANAIAHGKCRGRRDVTLVFPYWSFTKAPRPTRLGAFSF